MVSFQDVLYPGDAGNDSSKTQRLTRINAVIKTNVIADSIALRVNVFNDLIRSLALGNISEEDFVSRKHHLLYQVKPVYSLQDFERLLNDLFTYRELLDALYGIAWALVDMAPELDDAFSDLLNDAASNVLHVALLTSDAFHGFPQLLQETGESNALVSVGEFFVKAIDDAREQRSS